ncbi:MAG TPA: alpha/beta fold hydrolase [Candidatus Hydrogenedentes bacterium]|nr:alpha/beta fold hydrolase [Candidatus Hydrogenedentota bacterium]HIJ74140.1 alpha/beta fold hydrolase [Candidatus Hydrogenedentota bacterium]
MKLPTSGPETRRLDRVSPHASAKPVKGARRVLRGAARLLICAVVLLGGYGVVTDRLVTRADRRADRDAETGILRGAEPRDLGPEDARGAVLFVHGFVGAGNNFAELPERLAARGWRVRVMRLPGHGTTPRDLKEVRSDELLAAVTAEFAALRKRHGQVILIGHSMGGALGIFAAAHSDVDGLVLGAPYFGVTYRRYYLLPAEVWTRLLRPIVPWFYKGKTFLQVNRKEAKDRIVSYAWAPARGLLTLFDVGDRANQPEVLENVTCPVLMLHAPGDAAASPEAAKRAFNAIASNDKRAVWLERSNHHIFWDFEQADVFETVEDFVGFPPPKAQ